MVVVFILPHAEFGRNDHREDALHFIVYIEMDHHLLYHWFVIAKAFDLIEMNRKISQRILNFQILTDQSF